MKMSKMTRAALAVVGGGFAVPALAYSLDPLVAGPVAGSHGVDSQWVQVNMNWPGYNDPNKGIIDLARANQALSQFAGVDPSSPQAVDAGLWNTYSGVVGQVNFANADFNSTVWNVNGSSVVWGQIYGTRPLAPVFAGSPDSSYQNNFVGRFNGRLYIPYSGEWNLGVLVDDGFTFTLQGANNASLTMLRDGEAPPNLISYASNLDLAQGVYGFSMTGYNHLQAGVLSLEWWSRANPTWQTVSAANLFTSVSPVPEPGTAALLLAGLGLVGLAAVRRGSKRPLPGL